jgi:hypothetical protein
MGEQKRISRSHDSDVVLSHISAFLLIRNGQ